eukprot:12069482-Karenia_brevis.AAC.1
MGLCTAVMHGCATDLLAMDSHPRQDSTSKQTNEKQVVRTTCSRQVPKNPCLVWNLRLSCKLPATALRLEVATRWDHV